MLTWSLVVGWYILFLYSMSTAVDRHMAACAGVVILDISLFLFIYEYRRPTIFPSPLHPCSVSAPWPMYIDTVESIQTEHYAWGLLCDQWVLNFMYNLIDQLQGVSMTTIWLLPEFLLLLWIKGQGSHQKFEKSSLIFSWLPKKFPWPFYRQPNADICCMCTY